MIEFKNVTKIYKAKKADNTIALKDININFDSYGLVFITGTSGSGKSTFLNLMGGLDSPSRGEILVGNNDISKFKDKEYDSYRNTYAGFIFQEFNLLENLNVYENVELSLKLQNKNSNNKVINILKEVGIEDLKDRKINDLSGGQKQRVAIARALIKEPNIILADEPTGNLDSKSSTQIFNILKSISKSKLVIVVSHDEEATNKYADRIIKLEDGIIVKDTNKCDKVNNKEEIKFIDSKLPNIYRLKMAFNNLKVKPFKLFMTIILLSAAFIFMGVTTNLLLFDEKIFLTNTMKDNNNYNYIIGKKEYFLDSAPKEFSLDNKDIDYIERLVGKKINKIYELYDNGERIKFEFGKFIEKNLYYNADQNYNYFKFVELVDNDLASNVIGSIPTSNNEILVHKYFADYIIEYGIKLSDGSLYKPTSYDKIISERKAIKLGNNKVYISGIIDDDNSKFIKYKNTNYIEEKDRNNYLYYQFSYINLASRIYVKGFVDSANLKNDKSNLVKNISLEYYNDYIEPTKLKFCNNKIDIISKDGVKSVDTLKENEIILSYNEIAELDNKYKEKLNKFVKNNTSKSYKELEKNFALDYMKNNSINYLIILNIFTDDGYKINKKLKVVGISLDNNTYISNKYYDEYKPKSKEICNVIVNDSNINRVRKVFSRLEYSELYDVFKVKGIHYDYSVDAARNVIVNNVIISHKNTTIYYLIACLVFTLFALILFTNFIAVSISYAKKEIGILKALGTKNSDVTKIFGYESIIIAVISLLISTISIYVIFDVLNKYSYNDLLFTVRGYFINPLAILIMFIFAIMSAILVTSLSISKIVKIKPIDAILNK